MVLRARSKGFGFPCLHADAAHLPLRAHTFAWVICNAVFPHFADKPAALRELSRVMAASGRLVICHTDGREAINAIHRSIGGVMAHDEAPDQDQLAAWLHQARLTPLVLRDAPDHYLVVAGHDLVSHGGTTDAC
jgi:ubiquinone/menaquinone biosynthesis C-methylase UbiE